MNTRITRCSRCALPSSYPGMKLNNKKICNYCVYYDLFREREQITKDILRKEVGEIIERIKNKRKYEYDCIVAYSGGKDSTFLLYYLKNEFKLNILAHTLDNGFISRTAINNIQKMVEILNIDIRITRPPQKILNRIFTCALTEKMSYPKEVLAMMSPLCTVCQGMVFGTTINLAMKLGIPLMFIGYTPGQYPVVSLENFMKVKSSVYLSKDVYKDDPLDIIKIVRDPLDERYGEEIKDYYFKSQYIQAEEQVPRILFPFHLLIDYNETEILCELSRLGWEKPGDTDPCSTNCLLNTLGNYACVKRLKYHPYIGELSYLVRSGQLDYQDAINAEKIDMNSYAMTYSMKKLGLQKESI